VGWGSRTAVSVFPVLGRDVGSFLGNAGGATASRLSGAANGNSAATSSVAAEIDALRRIAANNKAPSPAAELRRAYQQAKGDIDFAHVEGHVGYKPTTGEPMVTGGHFSSSPKVQMPQGVWERYPSGVVRAPVQVRGPDGEWMWKSNTQNAMSTLTPESWSLARAKGEMSKAFLARYTAPTAETFGESAGVRFQFHKPNGTSVLQWRGYPVE
jgi:hypothetical protein